MKVKLIEAEKLIETPIECVFKLMVTMHIAGGVLCILNC